MIVLNTDVLSALMRREPELAVVGWLDQQPAESDYSYRNTLIGSTRDARRAGM